ncbi:hypothetical protein [Frankia sp. CiP3]|uniref:hypothetical protein n=1 Tax=Frankia sp. CiP3 TaxID=2880971 RepID=UPI001EF5F235|nr:hypothetical protein [Frankia sp. CiP3]
MAKPTDEERELWERLKDALEDDWRGRAVLSQLGRDPKEGSESLSKLLSEIQHLGGTYSPKLATIVASGGDVGKLVNVAQVVNIGAVRRRRITVFYAFVGAVVVLSGVLTSTVIYVNSPDDGAKKISTAIDADPSNALTGRAGSGTESEPRRLPSWLLDPNDPFAASLPAAYVPSEAVTALARAPVNSYSGYDGVPYEIRAVFLRSAPEDGSSAAKPGHHKIVVAVRFVNIQSDRKAPVPIGSDFFGVAVPIQYVGIQDRDLDDKPNGRSICDWGSGWENSWTSSNTSIQPDRCIQKLKLARQDADFNYVDVRIPAREYLDLLFVVVADISDAIPGQALILLAHDKLLSTGRL